MASYTVAWRLNGQVSYARISALLRVPPFNGLETIFDHFQCIRDRSVGKSVADNGGVNFVPAFAGLGAPHWDPEAQVSFMALLVGHSGAFGSSSLGRSRHADCRYLICDECGQQHAAGST